MAVDIKGMTPLLQVFDMATSLKFYCDVLGFQTMPLRRTQQYACLRHAASEYFLRDGRKRPA